jgi:hypothetical protein
MKDEGGNLFTLISMVKFAPLACKRWWESMITKCYAIFVVVTFVATFWFLNPKIVHGFLKFANPNQKNFIFGLMAPSESTLQVCYRMNCLCFATSM